MNIAHRVHIYTLGESCQTGAQPPMPDADSGPTWVPIPHEADPKATTAPTSWHEAWECPFLDEMQA